MQKKILPPTWLLIAILLMVALHLVIPAASILRLPWNLLGLIPLALGIVVEYTADRAFRLAHTTVKPFDEPGALITCSVYGFSRNPMYLGFALILAGIAILLGSLTPVLIIPLFVLAMDRWYISFEEQALAGKFGAAWQKYKLSTRRWL